MFSNEVFVSGNDMCDWSTEMYEHIPLGRTLVVFHYWISVLPWLNWLHHRTPLQGCSTFFFSMKQ